MLSTDHTKRRIVEDHRKKGYWRPEQYSVTGKRFEDKAAAEKAFRSQVQTLAGANGPLNTAARKTKGGGQEWGARGTGKVTEEKVNGFQGVRADATIKDVDTAGRNAPTCSHDRRRHLGQRARRCESSSGPRTTGRETR